MRLATTQTFVLLTALALLACSGGADLGVIIEPVASPSETPPAADGTPVGEPTAVGTPAGTATPGAIPASTPAAGATVAPAPTAPAGAAADLPRARRLEAEGELQSALNSYLAVAGTQGPARGEAVIGAARVLLDLDRAAEARGLLQPFIAGGAGDLAGPAHYLLARTFAFLDMPAQAAEQYDLYLRTGGPATPYARIDKARVLAEAGQGVAAANEAQAALAFALPTAARRSFLLNIAEAYEQAGALGDALGWYRNFLEAGGDRLTGLSGVRRIKQRLGDPSFRDDEFQIMAGFPSSPQALTVLNQVIARGEGVDASVRGLVFYRHRQYDNAFAAFNERIAAAPNAATTAEAYYYRAAIYEDRGQQAEALADYTRVLALNPSSHLADDSIWWRARIHEEAGRLDEAAALYAQVASSYPNSPWAADAAFRRGMLSYRTSAYAEAASAWQEGATAASTAYERQRFSFWQAKALLSAGNPAPARALLERLAVEAEDDYYGIRARALLEGRPNQPKAVVEPNINLTPNFDWAAAEAWLAAVTGRAVLPAPQQPWATDQRWLRAQELWLVGRKVQADAEVLALIESHASDAIGMYSMSRLLASDGRMRVSAYAGQRLLRVLNTKPNQGLPKALMSLSYPAAFPTSVQRYSQAERISPLLLLAFMRQESFFDPRAESPVGALGLTQVLPSTGRTIAQRLGVSGFDPEQLLQADLNVRFGANYMAVRLRELGSDLYVALAAYNAGVEPARRWLQTAGRDADLYVEVVDFRETRLYIEIVAENYAIYRWVYAGEPVPDLPRD